jgi:hypothetical protein
MRSRSPAECQSDNLVYPANGTSETMDVPADSIEKDPGATAALDAPGPRADEPPVPLRRCRILFHGLPASEPPRLEVKAWLVRLGALTAPMLDGEVTIEALEQGRKERNFGVRVELMMPAGSVIVRSNQPGNPPHEDVYVAIRNAFRATRRELETQLREQTPAAPKATPEVTPEVTQ